MITINYDINQPIWQVFSYCIDKWYVTIEECKVSSITIKNDMSLGIRIYRKSTKSSHMVPESLINTIEAQDNHFYFTSKDKAEEIYEKLVEQATRRNTEIEKRKEKIDFFF